MARLLQGRVTGFRCISTARELVKPRALGSSLCLQSLEASGVAEDLHLPQVHHESDAAGAGTPLREASVVEARCCLTPRHI